MAYFNRVILIGNLTRDPETRHSQQGLAICSFGIAVNHYRGSSAGGERKEEVMFIDVSAFDRQAENCQKFLTKGSNVLIEGRLVLDTWEDKQTGQKRSMHKVVAQNVQFMSTRNAGANPAAGGGYNAPGSGNFSPPNNSFSPQANNFSPPRSSGDEPSYDDGFDNSVPF